MLLNGTRRGVLMLTVAFLLLATHKLRAFFNNSNCQTNEIGISNPSKFRSILSSQATSGDNDWVVHNSDFHDTSSSRMESFDRRKTFFEGKRGANEIAASAKDRRTKKRELKPIDVKWTPDHDPNDKYSISRRHLSEEEVAGGALADGMSADPRVGVVYPHVKCTQNSSCQFYQDVLLVIKINPMRFLWADMLLNLYGTGFQNIVFYSTLDNDDTSRHKYLRVGPRRIFIQMIDDRLGYTDFVTLSDAMERYRHLNFTGYFYLHDDILFHYWKGLRYDKSKIWKQSLSKIPKGKAGHIHLDTKLAMIAIREKFNYTAMPHPDARKFLAETSGAYYIPNVNRGQVIDDYRMMARVFFEYKSYIEWATPALLHALSVGNQVRWEKFNGKLMWGRDRLMVKHYLVHKKQLNWYHPVKMQSEPITRLLDYLHSPNCPDLNGDSVVDYETLFTDKCLTCAMYPIKRMSLKGLVHGCLVAKDQSLCAGNNNTDYLALAVNQKMPPGIGGRCFVPKSRTEQRSPLEIDYEGFWNFELHEFMFKSYYDTFNHTKFGGVFLNPWPECCVEQ